MHVLNSRDLEWLRAKRAHAAFTASLGERTPWDSLVHFERMAWLAVARVLVDTNPNHSSPDRE